MLSQFSTDKQRFVATQKYGPSRYANIAKYSHTTIILYNTNGQVVTENRRNIIILIVRGMLLLCFANKTRSSVFESVFKRATKKPAKTLFVRAARDSDEED